MEDREWNARIQLEVAKRELAECQARMAELPSLIAILESIVEEYDHAPQDPAAQAAVHH